MTAPVVPTGQVKWTVDTPPGSSARVTFVPDARLLHVPGVTVVLANGELLGPDGSQAVTLRATDTANPADWTWTAHLRVDGNLILSFPFHLPAGAVVDLADVVPVDSSAGTPIIRGPKGDPGVDGAVGAPSTDAAREAFVPARLSDVALRAAFVTRVADATGTGDGARIQAAIDALGAAGGTVRLGIGTYILTAPLRLPSRVSLVGTGPDSTIIQQSTAGVSAIVSSNWFTGSGANLLGGTQIRDLSVRGATGAAAHGILLRDYRIQVENVQIRNCGGHGLFLTAYSEARTQVGSALVENYFRRMVIENCGGWGFFVESDGAFMTDGFIDDLAVNGGTAGTGGVQLQSSAGWSIGHIHTYGVFSGNAVSISNAWNTFLHSAQIETGWQGQGLGIYGMQRALHVGDVSVARGSTNTTGDAVHVEKSGLNPGDGMSIDSLTVIQDYDAAMTAITCDSTNTAVRVGAFTAAGTFASRITVAGGFGASVIKLIRDARVLTALGENTRSTSLTYGGVPLGHGHNKIWDGGAAQSLTFSVTLRNSVSTIGLLTIASATFNNGAALANYLGVLHLSSKVNATDSWAVSLVTVGTPVGFTVTPTVTVSAAPGDTRTVTVSFTPSSANGFGGSCALLLAAP